MSQLQRAFCGPRVLRRSSAPRLAPVQIHLSRFLHLPGMTTQPKARTDAQLIRAPDSGAFTELYRRHVASVHRWFVRRAEWAAADLTAETFAQAWLSRRRFRDER